MEKEVEVHSCPHPVSCFVSFAHDRKIFPFLYPAFDVKIKREILLFACKLLLRLPGRPSSQANQEWTSPAPITHRPSHRYAQTSDPTQSQHSALPALHIRVQEYSQVRHMSKPSDVGAAGRRMVGGQGHQVIASAIGD